MLHWYKSLCPYTTLNKARDVNLTQKDKHNENSVGRHTCRNIFWSMVFQQARQNATTKVQCW